MKNKVSAALIFLLLTALAAFAQSPNYSGEWELDAKKSKLPETWRVEAMTMIVAHDARQLATETKIKRAEGETPGGARTPGGGMGRGALIGGAAAYPLDGTETIVEPENPAGTPSSVYTYVGYMEKEGKLKLSVTRKTTAPTGEFVVKTRETWQLAEAGGALKVVRETQTPRGTQTAEMYFTKTGAASEGKFVIGGAAAENDLNSSLSVVSGGVINGRAINLVRPPYPPKARQERAYGTVNVQVVIDENGNVISANAVSGHETLRQAAESAARSSKFSPTYLEGKRVKVRGIIVYNFSWR